MTMSSLQFIAVIFFVVTGTCIRESTVVVGGEERWFFPYHHCSNLPIQQGSGLAKARANILTDLAKLHWHRRHRREQITCIRTTVEGSTMWARAECPDPTSIVCIGCLVAARDYLDGHCMYFTGGVVNEDFFNCAMVFGDYDVCAN